MQRISVFIFRRDLRLQDNSGLISCCKAASLAGIRVVPVFIFSPTQIKPSTNAYFGDKCVRFMLECLQELAQEISTFGGRLVYFEGDTIEVLDTLSNTVVIESVWSNMDVTPFAVARDRSITDWCKNNGINCESTDDYTLHSMDAIRNKTGGVYQVFTPFFRTCQGFSVNHPREFQTSNCFSNLDLPGTLDDINHYAAPRLATASVIGGRGNGIKILKDIATRKYAKYEDERNSPGDAKTTHLAAYLKFGAISVREVFQMVAESSSRSSVLMSQLYWREFYYQLTFHKPELLLGQVGGARNFPMRQRMISTKWKPAGGKDWEAWCSGHTGYPIVDAGMRQLLETGNMHNRCRMIVAMFLAKNLHIDWRHGERFFANHLIDYDPCQNNGGWQWSASTGVDTQPYRIFNAWTQTVRYDKECKYIKHWIPELHSVPAVDILRWNVASVREKYTSKGVYVAPIVDHSTSAAIGKAMLKGEDVPW